ncbi:MAG: hypothetical protein HQL32_09615 [Planctomycetes bacterium]|nr:hypothetical protein [Planctomycetota bacterium]
MKDSIGCNLCNGSMVLYEGPRFGKKVTLSMILLGVFCCLFWIGSIVGLPLLIAGFFMSRLKREMWVCKDCMVGIERIKIEQ